MYGARYIMDMDTRVQDIRHERAPLHAWCDIASFQDGTNISMVDAGCHGSNLLCSTDVVEGLVAGKCVLVSLRWLLVGCDIRAVSVE
jgi:hypothetical protein